MKNALIIIYAVTLLTSLFTSQAWASGSQELDLIKLPKYQTPVPYAGIRNWHVTQNLGPTGARGWVYGHRTHTRDSREILIKSVEPGSPADGILQPYDIIIGAAVPPDTPSTEWQSAPAVKPFDSDARLSLARAITWAESNQGKGELKLLRHRDGISETVVIKLPALGDYSKTAPFHCPKSDRIVEEAVDFLAERMPVEGFSKGVPQPMAAALLLASGNDVYLDHVRRSAYQMSINNSINDAGHETWRWGNTNLFLCEYYLATGDRRVLPTIEQYCKVLAEGQCNPGTWGHRAVPDFIPPGYGSVNATGVVCFLSMILGWQTGIEIDEQAIEHSINFYGSYAGRGGIPYGDHPPYNDPTCNGKNGMAAVAFHQLGADPAAQWFARMACSANLASFESGHSGNYFNQTWTPLAASLTGRENYANFWARFNSFRDLARRWDGSFMTQPQPDKREGDLGSGNYVKSGPMWSTGGLALSYLADTRRLAILGRTDSVFAANAPEELKDAINLYDEKKFNECREMAEAIAEKAPSERVLRLAKQLSDAARRNLNSIELTCESMKEALAAGDLYKLKWQLLGIESIMDIDDPRLEDFRDALEGSDAEEVMDQGKKYYDAVAGAQWSGLKGFEIITRHAQVDRRKRGALEKLAEEGEGPYDKMAEAYLQAYPKVVLIPDSFLIPPPSKGNESKPDNAVECWRYLSGNEDSDEKWKEVFFNDRRWKEVSLPSKEIASTDPGRLRAVFEVSDPEAIKSLSLEFDTSTPFKGYLNGKLILNETGGNNWKRRVTLLLKPVTRELLKKGDNCLAVEAAGFGADFTLVLKANRQDNQQN
jgi:hypothetical protein